MAKIKLSSIGITNLSGKAGGSVFSRNRGGNYVRNFAIPSNPSSLAQQEVRGVFGGLSASWRGLTDEQRQAWNAVTDDYPITDTFGDQKMLSGQQLFVALNSNLGNGGQPAINAPLAPQGTLAPSGASAPQFVVTAGAITTATFKLAFNIPSGLGAPGFTTIIEATATVSPGRSYVKNRYRVIGREPAGASSPATVDFTTMYPTVFGVPAVGGKVFIRAKFLNNNTGEVSAYVSTSVIVQEG